MQIQTYSITKKLTVMLMLASLLWLGLWLTLPTALQAQDGNELTGPTEAMIGQPVTFTAVLSLPETEPLTGSATSLFPLTYTWQATDLDTQSGQSDDQNLSASFMWEVTGTKVVTLQVESASLTEPLVLTRPIDITASPSENDYSFVVTVMSDTLSGFPGDTLTYTLHLTNTGNTTNTLSPNFETGTLGTLTWPISPVILSAMQTSTLLLPLEVSPQVTPGIAYTTPVTITALISPSNQAVVNLVTMVESNVPSGPTELYLPVVLKNYPPPPPSIDLVLFAPAGGVINQGLVFSTTVNPDSAVNRYRWEFGDGISADTTEPSATHAYATPGIYTVKVTAFSDQYGTTAEASQQLTIDRPLLNGTFDAPLAGTWLTQSGGFVVGGQARGSGLATGLASIDGDQRLLLGNPALGGGTGGGLPVGYGSTAQTFWVNPATPYLNITYRVQTYDFIQSDQNSRYFDNLEVVLVSKTNDFGPAIGVVDGTRNAIGCNASSNPTGALLAPAGGGLVFCAGNRGSVNDTPRLRDTGWRTVSLDASQFAGQEVTLFFTLWSREYVSSTWNNNAYYNTWAYLDNISLTANPQ